MQITLTAGSETSCTLKSSTCSTSVAFPVPVGAMPLIDAMRSLLADADKTEAFAGDVMLTKNSTAMKVHVGQAFFVLPIVNAVAIVLDAQ